MFKSFVIYNELQKQYLAGGDLYSVRYNLVDNPLWAHSYRSYEFAEKQIKSLTTAARREKTVIKLSIHELGIRKLQIVKHEVVVEQKVVSGYAVKVKVADQPVAYIKDRYSMLTRISTPTDFYYRCISKVVTNNLTPSVWKTRKGAEAVRDRLVDTVRIDNIGNRVVYAVVEYSEG